MSKYDKLLDWKKQTFAGIIFDAGNSEFYETGSWRTYRPEWDSEKCINCLRCFYLCPDSAIKLENAKVIGIDYEHCKGCGVCAFECPPKVKAITMRLEGESPEK